MSAHVERMVKTAVKEIVEAFREHGVTGAWDAYHGQRDVLFYKTHIIEGLREAGIPMIFIERIVK